MVIACPFLFSKSYSISIQSNWGDVSRQLCTDRFEYIDIALYGPEMDTSGRFQKGFFLFLFVVIYLLPLIIILTTCIRIALCLLKPIGIKQDSTQGRRMVHKREENKRRVSRELWPPDSLPLSSCSAFSSTKRGKTKEGRGENYIILLLFLSPPLLPLPLLRGENQ